MKVSKQLQEKRNRKSERRRKVKAGQTNGQRMNRPCKLESADRGARKINALMARIK